MADVRFDCAAVILAAGSSTRLGQLKQLVRIQGESLLRRTIRLAAEAGCSPIFVVLGADAEVLARQADGLSATIVLNEDWASGMASSLKSGLAAALTANPELENMMVLVCDQPRLELASLQSLLTKHRIEQPSITVSYYRETLGVPAIFSHKVFVELFELTGDQGARRILQRYHEQVAKVDFPGGEFDLDTPEDLLKLNQ